MVAGASILAALALQLNCLFPTSGCIAQSHPSAWTADPDIRLPDSVAERATSHATCRKVSTGTVG